MKDKPTKRFSFKKIRSSRSVREAKTFIKTILIKARSFLSKILTIKLLLVISNHSIPLFQQV